MKVVQLLPELNEGGVERGVVELTGKLKNFNTISVVISNGGKLVDELLKNGIRHIKIDVSNKNLLTFLPRVLKLRAILKELKPDIVHVRSRFPAWLLKFAKIGLNFKVVSTIHGLNSPNFYSKIMTDAAHIICVSNAAKEHIQKHFNTNDSKISVIFRGVDTSSFNPNILPSKDELRTEFNLKDELVISCVGRISQSKNIATLIKAVEILRQKETKISLLIAGGVHAKKQKHFKELKELCKKLNIDENVKFLGSISEVAKIYKLSDVVVSLSIKPESFGRSIAEAIAINTPVVASNHGGVKDIIIEGKNGYFFEPLNASELAEKILLAKELKFDGFNYIIDKFSLDKMCKENIKIYKELI
ncbi:glycosyltransferase family 4 protein [Campylobacter sp. 9BO]|uniref:glycosyltransferase family 4 protein n=1 Tax=Campylobacter sp. 9BO TaxID=3424759 RepID=UPI003D339565